MRRVVEVPKVARLKRDAHKGDRGRVLIVAGSARMSGAARLAGWGALRGGAGLVTIATPDVVQPIVAAELPFDPSAVTPIDLPDAGYRGRTGKRALYVWSDAFNRYSNRYLIELARAKGFDRVLLSAGRVLDAGKADRFRAEAAVSGLDIDLTLSTNAWLDPEARDGIDARISSLDLTDAGLHLDIEPQMRDDFDALR